MMPPSPRPLARQAGHLRLANRIRSPARTMINLKHELNVSMRFKMNIMRFSNE